MLATRPIPASASNANRAPAVANRAPFAVDRMTAAPNPRPPLEAEIMLAPEPAPPSLPKAFFISAHPRSGTNWLGCLMHLHRRVACWGEFTFHDVFAGVQQLVTAPGRAARVDPPKSVAVRGFQRFVRECMASLEPRKPGVEWVGDHTPRRLRLFLPGAAYIVLFRDGRDVLVSWTFNALARREAWVVPDAIKPMFESQLAAFDRGDNMLAAAALLDHEPWVRHVARQWASHVRDDLDAIARFDRGQLIGTVARIRYEELHADLETQRRRLYAFLGLDSLDAEPVSDATRTSTTFVKEEDPTSHYRRGVVGDWKDKLTPRAVRWVHDEAGTELAELAYDT
ncbi:MAG: sulfotransferase [Phycisphaerales bacterium]